MKKLTYTFLTLILTINLSLAATLTEHQSVDCIKGDQSARSTEKKEILPEEPATSSSSQEVKTSSF